MHLVGWAQLNIGLTCMCPTGGQRLPVGARRATLLQVARAAAPLCAGPLHPCSWHCAAPCTFGCLLSSTDETKDSAPCSVSTKRAELDHCCCCPTSFVKSHSCTHFSAKKGLFRKWRCSCAHACGRRAQAHKDAPHVSVCIARTARTNLARAPSSRARQTMRRMRPPSSCPCSQAMSSWPAPTACGTTCPRTTCCRCCPRPRRARCRRALFDLCQGYLGSGCGKGTAGGRCLELAAAAAKVELRRACCRCTLLSRS